MRTKRPNRTVKETKNQFSTIVRVPYKGRELTLPEICGTTLVELRGSKRGKEKNESVSFLEFAKKRSSSRKLTSTPGSSSALRGRGCMTMQCSFAPAKSSLLTTYAFLTRSYSAASVKRSCWTRVT